MRRRPAVYRVAADILGLEDAFGRGSDDVPWRLPGMLPVTIPESIVATLPPAISAENGGSERSV
jgi:hypothetical protein